jgi:hypothetical protein
MAGYFRVLFFANLLVALPCCLVGLGPRAWCAVVLGLVADSASTHSYKYDRCTCIKYPWVIGFGLLLPKPIPVYPMGGDFVPYPYPWVINFVPYPYPNRGIPHGLVGIESPLTSLLQTIKQASRFSCVRAIRSRHMVLYNNAALASAKSILRKNLEF